MLVLRDLELHLLLLKSIEIDSLYIIVATQVKFATSNFCFQNVIKTLCRAFAHFLIRHESIQRCNLMFVDCLTSHFHQIQFEAIRSDDYR